MVSFSSLRPFGPRRETAMLRAGLFLYYPILFDLQLRQSHHRAPGVALREAAVLSPRPGRDAEAFARYCFGAISQLLH